MVKKTTFCSRSIIKIAFFAALILILPLMILTSEVKGQEGRNGASYLPGLSAQDLWVDAAKGNNANDGRSAASPLLTIQRAADLAGPGTTIHIQPGVYRESVTPAQSGTASGTIRYIAQAGPGTVDIRGSDPSSALTWVRMTSNSIGLPAGVDPANIYYADLSAWGLDSSPRFVIELNDQGEVAIRLPMAREPDWHVDTPWKYSEFWWSADGGSDVAACYPPTDSNPNDCDTASRSLTQLTDRHNDTDPPGIEAGNLTTLGDLTGATLVVHDTATGTYTHHHKIIAHDVAAGRVTVDQNLENSLGWGSKYYVEGKPQLLDTPGEWWYDASSKRLYLWPRSSGNPSTMRLEISRRSDSFTLQNRSYITLDGLTFEFFNRYVIYARNTSFDKSHNDVVRNAILRYGEIGIRLSQYVDPKAPADMSIDGFTLENSEVAYMDSEALYIYSTWDPNSSASSFIRPGVLNTVIRNNEMHHLGFNENFEGNGTMFVFADHMLFEGNYVHDVAHNGVRFMRSVVQSSKSYGFTPQEIKTGDILIRNNIIEKACQNAIDCGALKISGTPSDRQVFRDLLVTGNIFRDTYGWSYVAEKRRAWGGGPNSDVKGMGGFGMYLDFASGIYAYRNIAYNNAFAGFKFAGAWRDGDIVYYNNVIANSLNGFHFGGRQYDTHDGSVNTQIVDNIILNNEDYGIYLSDADGTFENTALDHNLYYSNGWRNYDQGGQWGAGDIKLDVPGTAIFYQTLQDIRASSSWEDHGVEENPALWNYDVSDHDLFNGSWPDMHLTNASLGAIDRGVTALPDTLSAILKKFGVYDPFQGSAYDIGRYEAGFTILPAPSSAAVGPGGVAHYTLGTYPLDLPFPVTLQVSSPDPNLITSLKPAVIMPGSTATLIITDTHTCTKCIPGFWYTIKVSGDGSGFTNSTTVNLLVGGIRLYLPVMLQQK